MPSTLYPMCTHTDEASILTASCTMYCFCPPCSLFHFPSGASKALLSLNLLAFKSLFWDLLLSDTKILPAPSLPHSKRKRMSSFSAHDEFHSDRWTPVFLTVSESVGSLSSPPLNPHPGHSPILNSRETTVWSSTRCGPHTICFPFEHIPVGVDSCGWHNAAPCWAHVRKQQEWYVQLDNSGNTHSMHILWIPSQGLWPFVVTL